MTNELLQAALDYAAKGLAVFPLIEKDKKPLTANGFKDATTNVDKINEWWTIHPNANVGIATGEMSGGLVAIDMDIDTLPLPPVSPCAVSTLRLSLSTTP